MAEILPLVTTSALTASILADKIPPWISSFKKWVWTTVYKEQGITLLARDVGQLSMAQLLRFIHGLVETQKQKYIEWANQYDEWVMMQMDNDQQLLLPTDWLRFKISMTITRKNGATFEFQVPCRFKLLCEGQSAVVGVACWTDRRFWGFTNPYKPSYHLQLMYYMLESIMNFQSNNKHNQAPLWLTEVFNISIHAAQIENRECWLLDNCHPSNRKSVAASSPSPSPNNDVGEQLALLSSRPNHHRHHRHSTPTQPSLNDDSIASVTNIITSSTTHKQLTHQVAQCVGQQ